SGVLASPVLIGRTGAAEEIEREEREAAEEHRRADVMQTLHPRPPPREARVALWLSRWEERDEYRSRGGGPRGDDVQGVPAIRVALIGKKEYAEAHEESDEDRDGAGVIVCADRRQEAPAHRGILRAPRRNQIQEQWQPEPDRSDDAALGAIGEIVGALARLWRPC